MIPKFLASLLFLLSFLLPSLGFSIQNLDFDCAKALNGKRLFQISPKLQVELGERDILLRGKLYPFHEMGMEERMGWSVVDTEGTRIFSSPYDSIFVLERGDRVFLLDENAEVYLSGFFSEYWRGTNRPRLSANPHSRQALIPRKKLTALFFEEVPAVVIKTYPQDRWTLLKANLQPQMQLHFERLKDPSRFIPIGKGKSIELAAFETSAEGQLLISPTILQLGPDRAESFDIRLRTPAGDYPIRYGHRILLVNEKQELILDTLIRSDVGLDIFRDRDNPEGLYQKLPHAKRVIVVGRKARPS